MGVEIETIEPGDGTTFPKKGDTVVVHYLGSLKSGKKFDSSYDRGKPFQFKIGLGQVIKGWDEGMAQMSKGQKAKLTCSPDFAYGKQGVKGTMIDEEEHKQVYKGLGVSWSTTNASMKDEMRKKKKGPNETLIFDVDLIDIIPS